MCGAAAPTGCRPENVEWAWLVSCPRNSMSFVRRLPDQLAVFQDASDEQI
jgi:hypothetical protein